MATVSIYDICSHIRTGRFTPGQGGPGRNGLRLEDSVAAGIVPRKPPAKTGLVQLTPEQAAGVLVERVSVNGAVDGYQRDHLGTHAKKIAEAMTAGVDVPEVSLALDSGRVFAVDGQHRLIGSVIARKPVWAVIRPMTVDKRAERFSSQNKSRRVSGDIITLASSDPASLYVKEAVSANSSNPWSALVGERSSDTKISPALALQIVSAYSFSVIRSAGGAHGVQTPSLAKAAKFDRDAADELFTLISVFGTKRTNQLAFRPASLKAITNVATLCVRRSDDHKEDAARWLRHMGSFPWADYAWLTKERDIRNALLTHWNKRLSPAKRVRIS